MGFMENNKRLISYPLEDFEVPYSSEHDFYTAKYSLYGVIHHEGSLRWGHYWATCKSPQTGDWYKLNDDSITQVGHNKIVSNSGYVLFYERNENIYLPYHSF